MPSSPGRRSGRTAGGLAMLERLAGRHRITLGGRQGLRRPGLRRRAARRVGPRPTSPRLRHQAAARRSAIDGRTTRHPGYARASAAQADRGGVRLDQDHRRSGEDQVQRPRAGRLVLPARRRRLQPDPLAQAARGCAMIAGGGRMPHTPCAIRCSANRLHRSGPLCRAAHPSFRARANPPSSTAC